MVPAFPRFRPDFILVAILLAGPLPAVGAAEPAIQALRGAFVINEDNSHFFGTRPAEAMNLAGLHAFIDQYAGTKVTHLFLSPNSMRASFRSRTRDAIWDPVDGKEPTGAWPHHARRLHEAGIDPYAVWIARSRERNISPWLSMRMNDVHNVSEPGNSMHSSFWRAHPELRRLPGGPTQPWTNHALNYAHAAVRTRWTSCGSCSNATRPMDSSWTGCASAATSRPGANARKRTS